MNESLEFVDSAGKYETIATNMIRINRTNHLHLVGKVGEQSIVHVSVHRGKVTLLFRNRQQQILSTNIQPSIQEEDKEASSLATGF